MEQKEQKLMHEYDKDTYSFVIRMWYEKCDSIEDKGELRGWITHVQSGRRKYFRDTAVIGHFIAEYFSDHQT